MAEWYQQLNPFLVMRRAGLNVPDFTVDGISPEFVAGLLPGAGVKDSHDMGQQMQRAIRGGQYLDAGLLGAGAAAMAGSELLPGLLGSTARKGIKTGIEAVVDMAGATYRSRLLPAIEAMPQEKMTAQQAQGHFQKFPGGVGSDELEYTGVQGLLDQGGPVTRTGLLEQARGNPLEIKDVVKGGGEYPYREPSEWQTAINRAEMRQDFDEAQRLTLAWEEYEGLGPLGSAKFANYTLPGGEDYREMLLTLPDTKPFDPSKLEIKKNRQSVTQGDATLYYDGRKLGTYADPHDMGPDGEWRGGPDEYWQKVAKKIYDDDPYLSGGDRYRSGHWDEPNVLAHARYNTRTIDGDKTFFVEEIQSDWHQAGRDKGYDVAPERKAKLEARRREIEAIGKDAPSTLKQEWADIMNELQPNREGLRVPDAPYKATDKWAGLTFNRMMKEAIDSGHDRIAWTPGDVQAARYDLSQQVDKLKYNKNDDGTFNVIPYKDGEPIYSNEMDSVTGDELSNVVGKEMAEKMKNGEGVTEGNALSIEGEDLKIGGEGMKAFYDKTVKKAADKIAKKFGSKVEVKELGYDTPKQGEPVSSGVDRVDDMTDDQLLGELGYTGAKERNGQQVWTMKITPKMREHFGKGVALSGAGLLATGALRDDNQ